MLRSNILRSNPARRSGLRESSSSKGFPSHSRMTVFARTVHPVFGDLQAGAGGRTRTCGLCLVLAALCPLSYTRNSRYRNRGYSGPVLLSRRVSSHAPSRALPSSNRSRRTAPDEGARQSGVASPLARRGGNGRPATRRATRGGGRRRPPSSRGRPAPRPCAGRCRGEAPFVPVEGRFVARGQWAAMASMASLPAGQRSHGHHRPGSGVGLSNPEDALEGNDLV